LIFNGLSKSRQKTRGTAGELWIRIYEYEIPVKKIAD
jgi:hypothetical protein